MSFALTTRWLQAGLVLSLLMSGVLMFFPTGPLMTTYNATYEATFWGGRPLPPEALRHHAFLMGVTAAGVIGWVVTLWFVVAIPWRKRERWAWHAVFWGVLAWGGVDLLLCLAFGNVGEAVFASAGAGSLLLPTLLARRHFSTADGRR